MSSPVSPLLLSLSYLHPTRYELEDRARFFRRLDEPPGIPEPSAELVGIDLLLKFFFEYCRSAYLKLKLPFPKASERIETLYLRMHWDIPMRGSALGENNFSWGRQMAIPGKDGFPSKFEHLRTKFTLTGLISQDAFLHHPDLSLDLIPQGTARYVDGSLVQPFFLPCTD